MNLKLGQVFWKRNINEYGGLGRSDFECKVVGIKVCEFIDGSKFTDFLVEETRLNDYHESFKAKESRTHQESYRYDHNSNELTHWYEVNWPGHFAEWQKVKDKMLTTKPKDLRKGP